MLTAMLPALLACGDEESLSPVAPCAPVPSSSHWPSEAGILQLPPATPPAVFTPAPHRAPPPIPPMGQRVIGSPRLVPIVAEGDPFAELLFSFADAVPSSDWWTAVTAGFGVSSMVSGQAITGPEMDPQMSFQASVAYVKSAVAGTSVEPDGRTVYLLFLAPGIEVIDGDGIANCGCAELAGYHGPLDAEGDAIAIVQRCSADIDSQTNIASHEIIESATDPDTSTGYREPSEMPVWQGSVWSGQEVADICATTRVHEGGFEYQRSFTNGAAQAGDDPCVPPLAEPYYNVTAPQDWYPLPAGATVSIPITGWSSAARDDWFVYVAPSLETRFPAVFTSGESDMADGVTFYGINNGKTGALLVTNLAAPSGVTYVLHLTSRPSSPGSDTEHQWPVGFYVP
jgi:hypothetical protein